MTKALGQLQAKAARGRWAQPRCRNPAFHRDQVPIAGRTGAFSPGNLVSPDSGVLATVVSERPMRVLFSVTQRELLEARRGTGADKGEDLVVLLRLADGSLYKEKGKIDFIDVVVDPKTDGKIVRATFDNKDGALTDGQTVRVVIEGEKAPTMIAVPAAAIAQDQTGSYLFVVNDKNVAEQRRVKTGVSRDGAVAITEGLKEGERVIIQGQQRVRPGMTVNPSVAPPAASTQKQ